MRRVILFFIALLLLPITVNAMAVSESFEVGNEIVVNITAANESTLFFVIKPSAAGEQFVTAIYAGTSGSPNGALPGSPVIYDETYQDHEVTTVLENAYIYTVLGSATSTWTHPSSISLLSLDDLNTLNIAKNGSGIYEIKTANAFLRPIKLTGITNPDGYNYWTRIADTTATNTSVYCVTLNEDRGTSDIYATLVSRDISNNTDNAECAVRPVIVIDKQYIECNNSKPDVPQTGVADYFSQLGIFIVCAAGLLLILKRKSVFQKI